MRRFRWVEGGALREPLPEKALDVHSDDVSITDGRWIAVERLVAAAQVTDAQLLGLPLRREGRLATFDRGVRAFVPSGSDPSKVLSVIG